MLSPDTVDRTLSERLRHAQPSATIAISELARRLASEGKQVISLSTGELDFDTPAHIQAAAVDAISNGQTRYTDVSGTAALKAAIIRKFARDNQLHFDASQIIAATGAKQILFNALLATLNPGDEVIVAAPFWVSYTEMVSLNGGTPVVVVPDASAGFKLTPALLRGALTPATRWLILNSPSNPSGTLYSRSELQALAQVLADFPRVLVLADDIYEKIVFEAEFASFAQAAPAMQGRTLTVNGVSKSHAMTGWRLGYAGGPAWLIKAMNLLQSQSTSNPSSISQAAAVAALDGPQDFLAAWRERLRGRRDLALSILEQASPVLAPQRPVAAFYIFVDCTRAIGMRTESGQVIDSDMDVVKYLLEDAGVAVVPGAAFGVGGYFRLSFATSEAQLQAACQQIVAACKKLVHEK